MKLPEKIYPVEYGGFFDFTEDGFYSESVLNRDDYENVEQITEAISFRYNRYDALLKKAYQIVSCFTTDADLERWKVFREKGMIAPWQEQALSEIEGLKQFIEAKEEKENG